MSVSIGGNDFENSIINRQNRYVKCASTKIENQDVLFTFLVQTVSNGRRGWLIDNSSDIQASNYSCIFRRLALCVIEICWYSDNSVLYVLAKVGFSSFFHLGQYHRRNFFRLESFLAIFEFNLNTRLGIFIHDLEREHFEIALNLLVSELSANEALGIEHSSFGVRSRLVFCRVSDKPLSVRESHI
mmetsp:Transcript_1170/g.2522  ORF Transcript_1170/g.2522 Transcript_1170/m.2522 type:complete len:186 (-) Transcript_1170:283-840(-)